MPATLSSRAETGLNKFTLAHRINALRQVNNRTNWFYLAREYLFLGSVIGLTSAFYHYQMGGELSWIWNVPITLLAVILIGAGQHRLTTLAHEASHYMLFRNRQLNELVSDLFCLFPMWSTTHHYRIQHLAHHQFPNDPDRDPDVTQMSASGHRFAFPMTPRQFIWECVIKQCLWLPGLIRYIRIRARYASTGVVGGPYGTKPSAKPIMIGGTLYVVGLVGALTTLVFFGYPWHVAMATALLFVLVLIFYALVPGAWYLQTALKPDVSRRWITILRMTYMTVLLSGLAWLTYVTGKPWWVYYILLWIVPLFTTFSFFMILRQIVQHGNAGQDRYGNTRIFLVNRLIRFAVFPLGMDYHLPHHMFPMVPHYCLPRLHALLQETEEYQQAAVTVEGYFWHRQPPQHATVVELMTTARKS